MAKKKSKRKYTKKTTRKSKTQKTFSISGDNLIKTAVGVAVLHSVLHD